MNRFSLKATASVSINTAQDVFAALCTHLEDHIDIFRDGWSARANTPEAALEMSASKDTIHVALGAANNVVMAQAQDMVAAHLAEFAGTESADVQWFGSGSSPAEKRAFRMMQVKAASQITPHLRRLTLAGDDLMPFIDGMHVRLFLPVDMASPMREPTIAADGRPYWLGDVPAHVARIYTIRRLNIETGEIEVDFVLHGERHEYGLAPGTSFAKHAKPGATLGMYGPVGRTVPKASRYLLAGDLTALPMIARILEEIPPDAEARCLIEVEDGADRQTLTSGGRFDIRWLYRRTENAQPSQLLLQAALANDYLSGPQGGVILFAAHTKAAKQFREHLREVIKWPSDLHLVSGFWS